MATSIGTSGVIFPDATTQSTATPGLVVVQNYTSPATWTKPAGLKYIKVTVIAAGGNGGAGGPAIGGGGGGGGGISQGTFPVSSVPAPSYSVTVGSAGAPSSLGSVISATTGAAGTAGPSGAGGNGGVGSGGQINMNGIAGAPSFAFSTGGSGGVANLFTGQPGAGGTAGNAGGAGTGFGSGGGGAGSGSPSFGAGSAGNIIVEEYF